MSHTFRLANLRKFYAGETDAQRAAREKANKLRIEEMVKSWNEFKTNYPDLAKRMVC